MTNDNKVKMLALLNALKRQKNGEAVEFMTRRGLDYAVNYGVDMPTIKLIALDFGSDYEFAKYLFEQGVRELKLASFIVANAKDLSGGDLAFWASGLTNSELAENFGARLLSRSDALSSALEEWLADGAGKYLSYAALIALCKAIDAGNSTLTKERAQELADKFSQSEEPILRRAAENLEIRLD